MAITLVGMGYDTSPNYLGYVQGKESTGYAAGLRSYMNQTLSNAYFQIHTDEAASEIATIRVSVQWRTVGKNVAGTYGSYVNGLWSNFESPSTECNPHTSTKYSGTDWSIELHDIGEYERGGTVLTDSNTSLADEICPNGYSYANRTYDAIGMQFEAVVTYVDSSRSESRFVPGEFKFIYIPVYTLSGLSIEDDSLVVTYTCGDWKRTDDRWEIESLTQGGTELVSETQWGTIAASGRLCVPLEAFKRIPSSMTSTTVDVRMNANYRDEGEAWNHIEGTTTLTNSGDCNTPTLSLVSKSEDALVIAVGDANDKANPLETVYVTMEDYSGTGTTASTTPGSNVTFVYPPLNTNITIDAIGYDADGDASDEVTLSVSPITSNGEVLPVLAAEDGSAFVRLRFSPSAEWTFEPVYETVKFSGRARETVGFGVGGSVDGTLSCAIFDAEKYGDYYQSREDFEALVFAGICIYRDESGVRKRVFVKSLSESWDRELTIKTMKVSVQEVS